MGDKAILDHRAKVSVVPDEKLIEFLPVRVTLSR